MRLDTSDGIPLLGEERVKLKGRPGGVNVVGACGSLH